MINKWKNKQNHKLIQLILIDKEMDTVQLQEDYPENEDIKEESYRKIIV